MIANTIKSYVVALTSQLNPSERKRQKKFLILTLVILYARCLRVIDKHQQGLYVSDYCPEIGECVEGSHVMCTHYNPEREMGPLCADTKQVSITDEYAEILLGLINGVRSRAARGLDIGYERKKLPRGYGIIRLQWDPELATFAQLWANQCIFDFDSCRATKKFSDPGQLLVITQFTDPDWLLLGRRDYFNETGFNLKKVKYCLSGSVRSWYTTKREIDADIILGHKWSDNLLENPYLQLVQGSATHVGCGISIFKSFIYVPDTNDLILNIVRVVCNFSTRIREGHIYTTDPPTAVGYTIKCGCPLGYDEHSDCLCYESGRGLPFSCKYGQCKPHVVNLPIFTAEEVSPHKLINQLSRRRSNMESTKENHVELYNYNETYSKKQVKPSLFSKSMIFKLPTRNLIKSTSTNLYRNIFEESIKNYNDVNMNRKNNFYVRRNKTHSSIINFPVKYLDVKSNKEQDYKVMDLLNKLEQEAEYVQIDETKKDILNQKLKKIYNTFVERSKFSKKKLLKRNNINLLDYEPNKLNEYEDQVRGIKENDNIVEPTVIDCDNYNPRRNDEIFTKQNVINSVGIRNAFNIKDIRRNDFNNIMDNYSIEEDLLSLNRRKYYQNKLINLERKINELRNRRINPYNKYNS